jgi:UDP-glucuronate decarboxylase
MKKVLITGVTGQVGIRLGKLLSKAGYEVVGVGTTRAIEENRDSNSFLRFDLLVEDIDAMVMRVRPDLLVHLAWETEPVVFWESRKNLQWLNSSIKLIESFNRWGGERIMVSGTAAEYGWESQAPLIESGCESPTTLYGQSKLALLEHLRTQSTPFLWTRTFFQFGDEERSGKLIPSLIDALHAGEDFLIQRPNDVRDYIYIQDVVQIMFSLIASGEIGVFNVASGSGTTVRDLGSKVASIIGRKDLLQFCEQIEKPSIVQADVSKLKRTLGRFDYTNLDDAIKKTIEVRVKR